MPTSRRKIGRFLAGLSTPVFGFIIAMAISLITNGVIGLTLGLVIIAALVIGWHGFQEIGRLCKEE